MDDAVRAALPGYLARFEGECDWLYLDKNGAVTTGIGLLCPLSLAKTLPWRCLPDGSRASYADLSAAYASVLAEPPGRGGQYYRNTTHIRAEDEALGFLFSQTADRFERELSAPLRFGTTFVSSPPNCQLAILRMAWAMGGEFVDSGEWPLFHSAFIRGDWVTCADECKMKEEKQPKEFIQSNRANRWLFTDAYSAGGGLRLPPLDI